MSDKGLSQKEQLKARLAAMKAERAKAREDNQTQVVEEDRVSKLPKGFEARAARAQFEVEYNKRKEAAAERGVDFDRIKARSMTVEEAERWANSKRRKKNAKATGEDDEEDVDGSSYEWMAASQYKKRVKKMKANMEAYADSTKAWGDDDYSADSLQYAQGARPSAAAIDGLVAEVHEDIKRKIKAKTRRDPVYTDSAVDYINEKNRKFNRDLEKYYGKYTKDIKDSFERGTAL